MTKQRDYVREAALRKIRSKGIVLETALYDEVKASADHNGRSVDDEVNAELVAYRRSLA